MADGKDTPDEKDLLDRLVSDWASENPALDTSGMAVVGRIIVLGRLFEAETNAVLKAFELSYTEFDILATLRRSGPPYSLPPTQLCNAVLLTSGAMTAALDRLEDRKLISRAADRKDRRVKTAKLTTRGMSLTEKAAAERFRLALETLTSLTKPEQETLSGLLKKLMLEQSD